jgi:hypothetical protein
MGGHDDLIIHMAGKKLKGEKNMKKITAFLTGVALMLATASAMALPVPPPSFTIGGITFSDFSATLNNEGLSTPVSLAGLTLTPFILAGEPGFQISGSFAALSFPLPATPFISSVDLLLSYKATSHVGAIDSVGLSFNGSILVNPAIASVTETVFSDAGHLNAIGQAIVQVPSPLGVEVILDQALSTIYVTKDIIIDTFFGGVATISVIEQTVDTNPVPEPGTMMLLGAGFLGLAIYGKRRRNA